MGRGRCLSVPRTVVAVNKYDAGPSPLAEWRNDPLFPGVERILVCRIAYAPYPLLGSAKNRELMGKKQRGF